MNRFALTVFGLVALWLFLRRKRQTPHKPPSSSLTTATETSATPGSDDPLTVGSDSRDFDVFINFRGRDSRYTVTNVLYISLINAGFRVFLDNEEIRKGEVIEGELLRAITNSRVYIPIFSKDYASSRWCLRELAEMIHCWETSTGKTKKVILPIFYDVDVSEDVKLRSQMYTTALQEHKRKLGQATVKPWEDALRKVATIKGWNLNDHGLIELARHIKKEVFNKVIPNEVVPRVFNPLVGIDKPVHDIMKLLEVGNPDVRFIVIHGMGGIGKTTLAEAIFKEISSQFQGSCFLKDVKRSSSDDDIVKLQKKLLIDTLHLRSVPVSTISDGIDMISKRLHDQNVLIVLDDVDKRDHILKLAENSSWFGSKSRIIITTRNTGFLPNNEYSFYAMKMMGSHHALQLFCRHAFNKDSPPLNFYEISNQIVATTGGLPLALEVVGSSLYNKGIATWNYTLEKLKEAPHEDVQEKLRISYQALTYEQQQIFLDIACFFNNGKMTDPIYFWEACNLHPKSGIEILIQRSMIKVYGDDTLWMHDQLRDLGRVISMPRLENQLPSKPSRLWCPKAALDIVQKEEVDESVLALNLGALDADCHFVREQFKRGVKLKFLQLQGGKFEGDFKNVLQQLIWLSWSDCPLRFEVANLSFKNLVVLKISRSQITEDWGGWDAFMEAKSLKVMHLESCRCLKKTRDFSSFLELERLILKNCSELEEIDESINKLKHLNYLEISSGITLIGPLGKFMGQYDVSARPRLLPDSIGSLKSLIELKIEYSGLTELHPSIGELANLKLLCLRCPQLEILPGSIGKLISLVVLDLSYSRIRELPDSIGDLKRLNIIRMEHSAIEYLPDTMERLESLEELKLHGTGISRLPETIRNLKRLKVISLSWFRASSSGLGEFPEVTYFDQHSLTHLPSSLESLILYDVTSRIDWQLLSRLSNLSILRLVGCQLKMIRVDCLEHLCVLCLEHCIFLSRLSVISSVKKLQELSIINCPNLVAIDGLTEMKSLRLLTWVNNVDRA